MGLGALAIVGLVRALQRRAPSRRSRAARGGGPRGRRKPTQCTGPDPADATRSDRRSRRSGENPRGPLSHKDAGATLRASLGRRPAVSGFSGVSQLDRAEPVQHMLGDLHTCGRSCGQRLRRWTSDGPRPHVVARRTVSVDGRRDLGPGFGDAARPARARHLGRLVPRRAPARLRRRHPPPERPELARRRAHPLQLLGDAHRRHPRLHRRHRARRAPRGDRRRRSASRSRSRPHRSWWSHDEHELDPLARWRCRSTAPTTRRRRHLGVGHAQRPLHLRPVRHRRVQPLRPRRRALGRREPGTVLQPAVHLRAGRVWARPTSSTRSATTSARCSATSGCATCPPSRS